MELVQQLKAFVKENNLFEPSERLLLAVSGGKDSVLMARLFEEAGWNFAIVHCNFKLREEDSEQDEQFVAELASEYQVPFYSKAFYTEEYAGSNGISIQMAARELRYQWFEEIRIAEGYHYIALAQHQNDVVETVLLNLIRGTGLAGLHGILPKRGKLIRPLLFMKSSEIEEAVHGLGLHYRDDISNFSTKYARNKLRLKVIPLLKAINPSLEETFMANSNRFEALEKMLLQYADSLRKQLFTETEKGVFHLNILKLKALDPHNTLLFEVFRPFGFTAAVLNDLATSLDSIPGKRFYSKSHEIVLDRKELIVKPVSDAAADDTFIEGFDIPAHWDKYIFQAVEGSLQETVTDKNMIKLDAAKICFPLRIRSWKTGDTFRPLGMNGRKKLSDLFISLKIPVSEKLSVPVLENANGDIIWVAPYRMDDRYKITAETKKVIILEQLLLHGR